MAFILYFWGSVVGNLSVKLLENAVSFHCLSSSLLNEIRRLHNDNYLKLEFTSVEVNDEIRSQWQCVLFLKVFPHWSLK